MAVRSADDSTSLNISDYTESEINLRVEEQPEQTTDNHADENNGAVDYTEYHKIIEEMKGE